MNRFTPLSALAATVLALPASAQLGSQTFKIETQTITGNNLQLGIAYEALSGLFFTTARGVGSAPPHQIYVFDATGALVTQFDQPASSNATTWGYRDGASNLVGQLFFGWDGGIDVYDPPQLPLTGLTLVLEPVELVLVTVTVSVAVAVSVLRELVSDEWISVERVDVNVNTVSVLELAVELDTVVLDWVTLLSVPDELDTEELVCEPEVEVAVPLLLVAALVQVL